MKYSKYDGPSDQEAKRYWTGYGKTTTVRPIGVRLINYTFEAPHGFDDINLITVAPEDWPYTSAAAAAAEEVK